MTQPGFELAVILLPQTPEYWNYKCMLPHSASGFLSDDSSTFAESRQAALFLPRSHQSYPGARGPPSRVHCTFLLLLWMHLCSKANPAFFTFHPIFFSFLKARCSCLFFFKYHRGLPVYGSSSSCVFARISSFWDLKKLYPMFFSSDSFILLFHSLRKLACSYFGDSLTS